MAKAYGIDDLLFGIRRSVRYHTRRRAFYDRLRKINTVVGLLGGSAVIVSLLAGIGPAWALAFSAAIALSSAVDLAINSSESARFHHDLSRRYFDIEKEIVSTPAPPSETIAAWTRERLSIEADEPPVLHVLNAICHNELCRAMGYGKEHRAHITCSQRIFSNLIDINEHNIKTPTSC